jgi:hypothetical protein
MTDYANDAVTEGALIRLQESTRITIARLLDAVEAAQGVMDATRLARRDGLTRKDLGKIQAENLKLASGIEFARDHADISTKISASISAGVWDSL